MCENKKVLPEMEVEHKYVKSTPNQVADEFTESLKLKIFED